MEKMETGAAMPALTLMEWGMNYKKFVAKTRGQFAHKHWRS